MRLEKMILDTFGSRDVDQLTTGEVFLQFGILALAFCLLLLVGCWLQYAIRRKFYGSNATLGD